MRPNDKSFNAIMDKNIFRIDFGLMQKTKRVYVDDSLLVGNIVPLDANYLKVLRLGFGSHIRVFNFKEEYIARICSKNECVVEYLIRSAKNMYASKTLEKSNIESNNAEQLKISNNDKYDNNRILINLAVGIIKPSNMSLIVEQCIALGVAQIFPLMSERSQIREFNKSRYQRIAIEAIEQSEQIGFAKIHNPVKLQEFLKQTSSSLISQDLNNLSDVIESRVLIFCDEMTFYERENQGSENPNRENLDSEFCKNNEELNDEKLSVLPIAHIEDVFNLSQISQQKFKHNKSYSYASAGLDFQKQLIELKNSGVTEFTILIGPEGGFSPQEREMILKYRNIPLSFKNILRTEVAAVASIALVSHALGA